MPATLQAVSAETYIKEEYADSFHAGNGGSSSEVEEIKRHLGFDLTKTQQAAPRILAAFQEHGFNLYRPSDVETYKKKQARQVKLKAEKGLHFIEALMALFGLLIALSGFGLTIAGTAAFWYMSISSFAWTAGVVVFLFSCAGFASCSGLMSNYKYVYGLAKAEWQDHSLESFPDQPPREVLSLALAIKKAIPNVTFTVSKLDLKREVVKRPVRVRRLDPILYATLPGEDLRLPVAIWDEPRFEGKPIMASSDIS